jgi:hypothetical protein
MRMHTIVMVYVVAALGVAQTQESAVVPRVTTVSVEEGAVTLLHLASGYTSSVKLPEEISSVVVGNPARFKAEHSDAEPRLVFLKPTTSRPSESNALITTRSGQEITLHLVSTGKVAADPPIDFLVEYRRPQSAIVSSSDRQSFLIGETRSISQVASTSSPPIREKPDLVSTELDLLLKLNRSGDKSLGSPSRPPEWAPASTSRLLPYSRESPHNVPQARFWTADETPASRFWSCEGNGDLSTIENTGRRRMGEA